MTSKFMKNFSIIAIEQLSDDDHQRMVTSIIKDIMPFGIFLGVADVLYQDVINLDTNSWTEHPGPDDAILYWSGRTNIINSSWQFYNLVSEHDSTDKFHVKKALDKGTYVVFAVGNILPGTAPAQDYNTNLVPISATNPFDFTAGALKNSTIAQYSFSNPRFVDYFLDGSFNQSSGTSFAAPRLTAYISKITNWYPHYGYSQIRTMLEKNSASAIGKNNQIIDTVADVKKELDATLDVKVIIEDLIEIFQGRNPTDQEVTDLANTIKFKPSTTPVAYYNENVAKSFLVYKAAFDRMPDAVGLDYWTTKIDEGMSVDAVTKEFMNSVEFQNLYGTDLTVTGFLTKVYNNVLDRDPDQSGLEWWTKEINKGRSWSSVLAEFAQSAENKNNILPLINNKTSIQAWANADEIVTNIAKNANTDRQDVPLVDQISALYHVFLNREPTVKQLEKWVDVYKDFNQDWGDVCNAWMQTEKVTLLGTYDFEINNYQAIVL